MIQKLELANDHVMAWRVEGKIDQKEYDPLIKSLENKLNTTDHINIYMEIPETPGITPQAFWDGLKSGFANLKAYNKKLDKVAVVTDKGWLQTMANIENRLFPDIEERVFSFEDAEKAKQWVRK